MADTSRLELRDELLYSIGLASGPIRRAIEDRVGQPHALAVVRARFEEDRKEFERLAIRFCTIDGLVLNDELNWILREFWGIRECLGPLEHDAIREEAPRCLERALRSLRERIGRVPVDAPQVVLDATPFNSYVRLRSMVLGALASVELFDPYVDDVVYHRYLSAVPEHVTILVVTSSRNLGVGQSDARALARRDRIVATSELVALERPEAYRLLSTSALHDRYLRIDGVTAHLGGSLKDAGRSDPYTISALATSVSDAALATIVAEAEVWYAKGITHRRG